MPWSGTAVQAQPGAKAPPIVVSSGPASVAVTIYRDPSRRKGGSIEFDANGEEPLGGFALIDEVREIDLPPGAVTIRFEGVASGIVPQSATLFDTDLAEKNFDSRLLSQRGLLDAFTGQSVTIRRTDKATGKQTREAGTIVSRPDGLILRTAGGYEAIRCDGTFDTILFPGKPIDLTAKPTLSLTTRADQKGGRVKLHLAYLAGNFDWQANYVATFTPDGQSIDLMAWMTLASHDRTSFADAELSVIAGEVYRARTTYEEEEAIREEQENDPYAPDNIDISYSCWPEGRTAAYPGGGGAFRPGALPERRFEMDMRPLLEGGDEEYDEADAIVITGSRIARRSDVGDLKLYTVPQPATVASQSMKQVRLIDHRKIAGETLYTAKYREEDLYDQKLVFRFRNDEKSGLGEPMPMGMAALFQETRLGRQLLGEVGVEDKAENEQVDIEIPNDVGTDIDIDFDEDLLKEDKDKSRRRVTISNDESFPVVVEVEFADGYEHVLSRFSKRVTSRDGRRVWRVEVPAEAERSIDFTSTELPDEEDNEN